MRKRLRVAALLAPLLVVGGCSDSPVQPRHAEAVDLPLQVTDVGTVDVVITQTGAPSTAHPVRSLTAQLSGTSASVNDYYFEWRGAVDVVAEGYGRYWAHYDSQPGYYFEATVKVTGPDGVAHSFFFRELEPVEPGWEPGCNLGWCDRWRDPS